VFSRNHRKETLETITKMDVSPPRFTGRLASFSSIALMSFEEYIMIPNLIGTLS
jgi:hypothetical protein